MEDSNNSTINKPSEDYVIQNAEQPQDKYKTEPLIFSLWVIAFALLASNFGDLYSGESHSTKLLILTIVCNIVVWIMNYSIAKALLGDERINQNGSSILKFNVYAVVGAGIISIISSFGLSEENIIEIITSIGGLAILPCYLLSQFLVAAKLIKKGGIAFWLGISIIAVISLLVLTVVLTYDLTFKKSTETLYLGCYGALTLVEFLMYYCYKILFKNSEK